PRDGARGGPLGGAPAGALDGTPSLAGVRRTVPLGWKCDTPQMALAFIPPAPLDALEVPAGHPSLPSPTGEDGLGRRLLVVRAAFNVRIKLVRQPGLPPRFQRVAEPRSISQQAFDLLVTPILPEAQRDPKLPACQMSLNLVMVSDEPCRLQLMPPFLSPALRRWPGTLVSGRFPLENWPRPLNAILEWQDPSRDWILRRGDPLAYLMPQYDDPALVPELVEVAQSKPLIRHIMRLNMVTEVARNVGPMFEEARRRRPKRLVIPKRDA
ncbi:MAG: hypothetical protein AAF677_03055, partial [Pseudomonadota bacterium]